MLRRFLWLAAATSTLGLLAVASAALAQDRNPDTIKVVYEPAPLPDKSNYMTDGAAETPPRGAASPVT